MKYLPKPKQVEAERFLLTHPIAGLFVRMGIGKTVVALSMIEKLMYESPLIKRVLIVAPLRVTKITWPDEIEKWSHTKRLTYSVIHGPKKEELARGCHNTDVTLINYDGIIWAYNHWELFPKYDVLILDESTFVKNHTSARSKLISQLSRFITRKILLTGSPTPNGLINLWQQIFILDRGRRLGQNITTFRNRYYMYDSYRDEYKLLAGAKRKILEAVKDIVMVVEDDASIPPVVNNIIKIDLPTKLYQKYCELERDFFTVLDTGQTIDVLNQQAQTQKLRQFVSGFVYEREMDENGKVITTDVVNIHHERVKCLKEIQESLSGENLLVAINFQEDAEQIQAYFKKRIPVINSNTSEKDAIKYIRDWNAGKLPMLLAYPSSIGHGLNLQSGGHNIVWYNCTWSLELWEQFIARLARMMQKSKKVFNHIIVMGDTIDEPIVSSVLKKEADQRSVMSHLKAYREGRK